MYKSFDPLDPDGSHAGMPVARFQERHVVLGEIAPEFANNARWHQVEDVAALMKFARANKAGNVVLPYSRSTGFRSLARMVSALRQMGNERMRIVVREDCKRLRLSQTTALIRLGVSVVLPLSLSSAAARHQAAALEGSQYKAAYRTDVDRVISESRLMQLRAELTLTAFQAHTKAVLGATSQDIPHTLVVLHPMTAAGVEAISASLAVGLRDGVYSVHPEGIWLLLMGCKPMDCQVVLERVLGQRFESLLVGWRKMGRPVDILFTIQELSGEATSLSA